MKKNIEKFLDSLSENLSVYGNEGKIFGIFGKSNLDRLNDIKGDDLYKSEARKEMEDRIKRYKLLTGFRKYIMKIFTSVEDDITLLQYFELDDAISTTRENICTNIGGIIIDGMKLSVKSFLENIAGIFSKWSTDFYLRDEFLPVQLSVDNFQSEHSEWLKQEGGSPVAAASIISPSVSPPISSAIAPHVFSSEENDRMNDSLTALDKREEERSAALERIPEKAAAEAVIMYRKMVAEERAREKSLVDSAESTQERVDFRPTVF
jgi:hypothetical protein